MWPRTAISCLLRGDSVERFLAHFGLKCSSFTPVNAGTSSRAPCCSIGNMEFDADAAGLLLKGLLVLAVAMLGLPQVTVLVCFLAAVAADPAVLF